MSSRRSFLSRLAAAGAVLAAAPGRLFGNGAATARGADPTSFTGPARTRYVGPDGMPRPPAGPLPPEFWRELRAEFLIPDDEAFFNSGTLGSSPRAVLDAVVEHMTHVDRDIAHWDYKSGHENYFTGYYPETWVREKIAGLINADPAGVALTQNATFGMNFLANGMDLGPGDEVVIMEGAHPGGRCGWELREARYGANIRTIEPPIPPRDPAQLIRLFERATTPRTRLWAIPHLTSATAILFPVEELCRRARQRGIFTAVDGAQTFGHLAIDVQAMGCDAFYSSPHKWMLSPKGTGFLYVREDAMPRVWSTLASSHWDNHDDPGFRLMQYGTGNLSLLVGLEKALDFHAAIGSDRVQARITGLADRLREGLHDVPGVRIHSPEHPAMTTATTIWSMDGVGAIELMDEMWNRSKVRVRSMGGPLGVRQCVHVYTLEEDIERAIATARDISSSRS